MLKSELTEMRQKAPCIPAGDEWRAPPLMIFDSVCGSDVIQFHLPITLLKASAPMKHPKGARRTKTATFLIELPLQVDEVQAARLRAHLEAGRCLYSYGFVRGSCS